MGRYLRFRKIISVILSIATCAILFAGCAQQAQETITETQAPISSIGIVDSALSAMEEHNTAASKELAAAAKLAYPEHKLPIMEMSGPYVATNINGEERDHDTYVHYGPYLFVHVDGTATYVPNPGSEEDGIWFTLSELRFYNDEQSIRYTFKNTQGHKRFIMTIDGVEYTFTKL